ncbi:LIM domain-containing protein 2 [Dispira simplex]|nr:LIM domain-containing protein 2 [Dispira simplex]
MTVQYQNDWSQLQTCHICTKPVRPLESLLVNHKLIHAACLRCHTCGQRLRLATYHKMQNLFYCKPHFDSLVRAMQTSPLLNTPSTSSANLANIMRESLEHTTHNPKQLLNHSSIRHSLGSFPSKVLLHPTQQSSEPPKPSRVSLEEKVAQRQAGLRQLTKSFQTGRGLSPPTTSTVEILPTTTDHAPSAVPCSEGSHLRDHSALSHVNTSLSGSKPTHSHLNQAGFRQPYKEKSELILNLLTPTRRHTADGEGNRVISCRTSRVPSPSLKRNRPVPITLSQRRQSDIPLLTPSLLSPHRLERVPSGLAAISTPGHRPPLAAHIPLHDRIRSYQAAVQQTITAKPKPIPLSQHGDWKQDLVPDHCSVMSNSYPPQPLASRFNHLRHFYESRVKPSPQLVTSPHRNTQLGGYCPPASKSRAALETGMTRNVTHRASVEHQGRANLLGRQVYCQVCGRNCTVINRIIFQGAVYHPHCLRCHICQRLLTPRTGRKVGDRLLCTVDCGRDIPQSAASFTLQPLSSPRTTIHMGNGQKELVEYAVPLPQNKEMAPKLTQPSSLLPEQQPNLIIQRVPTALSKTTSFRISRSPSPLLLADTRISRPHLPVLVDSRPVQPLDVLSRQTSMERLQAVLEEEDVKDYVLPTPNSTNDEELSGSIKKHFVKVLSDLPSAVDNQQVPRSVLVTPPNSHNTSTAAASDSHEFNNENAPVTVPRYPSPINTPTEVHNEGHQEIKSTAPLTTCIQECSEKIEEPTTATYRPNRDPDSYVEATGDSLGKERSLTQTATHVRQILEKAHCQPLEAEDVFLLTDYITRLETLLVSRGDQ